MCLNCEGDATFCRVVIVNYIRELFLPFQRLKLSAPRHAFPSWLYAISIVVACTIISAVLPVEYFALKVFIHCFKRYLCLCGLHVVSMETFQVPTVIILRHLWFPFVGKFLQCRKEAKWKHWFHLKCFNSDRTGEPLCPHCGEKSEQHEVVLRLKAFEASVAERILGESGDRVVQEVGVASSTSATTVNAETAAPAATSSSSSNQLVPTANPPQRAKMSFEKYLKTGFKTTPSSSSGVPTKSEEKTDTKFDVDASRVVNVKKADGSEFKFRHMPLGLPADIMVIGNINN